MSSSDPSTTAIGPVRDPALVIPRSLQHDMQLDGLKDGRTHENMCATADVVGVVWQDSLAEF
jgi:hypothetical protein